MILKVDVLELLVAPPNERDDDKASDVDLDGRCQVLLPLMLSIVIIRMSMMHVKIMLKVMT